MRIASLLTRSEAIQQHSLYPHSSYSPDMER